jgi:hypothetical protein
MDAVESFKTHVIVAWSDDYFIITPNSKILFHPYSAALCRVD